MLSHFATTGSLTDEQKTALEKLIRERTKHALELIYHGGLLTVFSRITDEELGEILRPEQIQKFEFFRMYRPKVSPDSMRQ